MRFFTRFKISDKELCPCGSNLKYLECCKNKKDKTDTNKKTIEVQIGDALRKQLFKCCLHPDKSRCVKHIKEAHALQNNKILSKLKVDGHVYMIDTKKNPTINPIRKGEIEVIHEIQRVGVKNATTNTCFCDLHDDEVFADIEKGACNFDKNNEKQKFLYAYKAFIFEYYKELVSLKVFQKQVKDKPSILRIPYMVLNFRQIQKKQSEMQQYKLFFDNGLLSNDYSGLVTYIVEIPQLINFANYACIAPEYDLLGNRIKNIDRKKDSMSRIFLTVFPESDKSFILVSHLKSDAKSYTTFGSQLSFIDLNTIKYYFTIMLPLYSENVVLSPRLWDTWDMKTKKSFTFYANRQGNQFNIYKKIMSYAMKNIKRQKLSLEDGKRCLIDLFR